jgi:hypothetical protein
VLYIPQDVSLPIKKIPVSARSSLKDLTHLLNEGREVLHAKLARSDGHGHKFVVIFSKDQKDKILNPRANLFWDHGNRSLLPLKGDVIIAKVSEFSTNRFSVHSFSEIEMKVLIDSCLSRLQQVPQDQRDLGQRKSGASHTQSG